MKYGFAYVLLFLFAQFEIYAMERQTAHQLGLVGSVSSVRNLQNAIVCMNDQSALERLLQELSQVSKYGQYGWVDGIQMIMQAVKDKSLPFVESMQTIIQVYGDRLCALSPEFNRQLSLISDILNSCRYKWVSSESITNFFESDRMVSARKAKPKQLLKNTRKMLEKELAQKNQEIAELKQEKKYTLEGLEQLQSFINESNATALDADVLAVRVPRSLDPFVRWLVFLLDTIVRRLQCTATHIAPEELVRLRGLAQSVDSFLAHKAPMKEMIDSTLKGADDDFMNKMDDLEKIEKREFVEPVPQFIRDFVHSILLKLADSAYHQGYHREKAKRGQSLQDEKDNFICRDTETIMLNAIRDTFKNAECANDLMILTQEQFFSHIPEYMRSFVRQLVCGICSCTKQVITLEKTVNAIDTFLEVNLQLKIRLERAVREKNIDELKSLSEAEYFAGLPASRSDMNVFMRFIIKLLLDSVRQTDGHIMDVSA